MTRKAAFFDLDGTLAIANGPPLQADVQAIRRLRSQGHMAFLCTGRAPAHLYRDILDIGFDGMVLAAGAVVRLGGRELWRQAVEAATLRRLLTAILETGVRGVAEGEQSLYCLNRGPEQGWPRIDSPDAFDGPLLGQEVYKFTLFDEPGEPVLAALGSGFYLIRHGPYSEVVPAGCSKSAGMRIILETVGIDPADSLAFGDSPNDLDMLQYAGTGIAMGNAPDAIKQAADYVTAPYDEAGVAAGLAACGL